MNFNSINSDMKAFFKNLLIVLFFIVLADQMVGAVLRYFYFRQESGLEYQTIYSMNKTSEDVLIFGSSRASHHYIPSIITDSTGYSCYNTGREGNFTLYELAILRGVLKRYKPKFIVVDFTVKEFLEFPGSYDPLSNLLPFYRGNPDIHDIIKLRGDYEPLKLRSAIYPFNSLMPVILVGNMEYNKKRKANDKGYFALHGKMKQPPQALQLDKKYPVDSNKVNAFRSILELCNSKNIPVMVVVSPYYDKYSSQDYSVELAKEIAAKHDVPFYDFLQYSPIAGNPEMFHDKDHLSYSGARILSEKIASLIRENISSSNE